MADMIRVVITHDRLPQLIQRAPGEVDRRIEMLAQAGRNYAVESIHRPSPGQPYVRSNPRRTGIAAAVGQTPNTDTGNLANSITVENAGQFQRRIDVGAGYGAFLEFGTPKMGKRPFMEPAMLKVEALVPEIFDRLAESVL